ncbi:MAG: hypothetical protein JRG91_04305 [Deltaproteobacteria bacterium]|nr:hypothetical protein [Deltaproteobacteria bacterium]
MAEKKVRRQIKGSRKSNVPRVGREIPINLERIMMQAVRDEAFRERLIEDPVGASTDEDFELKGTERAMLSAMDRSTIEALVQRFGAPKARRSGFAKGVAAAVAGSMIISVSACGETKGVGPEPPDGTTDSTDPIVDDAADVAPTGILPDMPDVYEEPIEDGLDADVIVDTPHEGSWGVLPDMPDDVDDDG